MSPSTSAVAGTTVDEGNPAVDGILAVACALLLQESLMRFSLSGIPAVAVKTDILDVLAAVGLLVIPAF